MLHFVSWAYRGTLVWKRDAVLPLEELTRYWKGKEKTSVVDVVEYVKLLKANIELVQEIVQKN